jgi:uncharacterized protein (TIGR02594 family)
VTPLEYAQRELASGVREATGRNDGVPAERYNDGERKPWCASFVRWCFEQAGTPLPGRRHLLPSVSYLEGALLARGARVSRAKPGAIICFVGRASSDAGPGRHVGIVESCGPGNKITTIEGNSGDRVARRIYAADDPAIAGFYVWPKRTA